MEKNSRFPTMNARAVPAWVGCPGREASVASTDVIPAMTVVFVEVRTRSNTSHGHPAETVGHQKQRRVAQLATAYIRRHRLEDCHVRIDVVTVTFDGPDGNPVVEHFQNAFDSPW